MQRCQDPTSKCNFIIMFITCLLTFLCIHLRLTENEAKIVMHAKYLGSTRCRINTEAPKPLIMTQQSHVWMTDSSKYIPKSKTHNNKSFYDKIQHISVLLLENLKEFTSNTTLHGFRYLLNKKYTKIERIWWLIMVICSAILCGIFIRKIWVHRDQTPVILQYADVTSSIWNIPFPAVTICSETKVRQRVFNYSKACIERRNNPSMMDIDYLKLYHDALLVCDNNESDGPDFANVNSIDTLRRFAPSSKEIFLECLWGNLTCDQMFYETLTEDGYCFTFNMLSPEDLFRTENLHKDYRYAYGPSRRTTWTLLNGYGSNTPVHTYPLRGLSYVGVEFEVILLTDLHDVDAMCRGPIQGFKIWLHNPAELPNVSQNYYRLPIAHQLTAALKASATVTSPAIRKYPPTKRKCYFPDERYLRFFRTYTERNCELECTANYTEVQCGCVPPYMPHGPSTKICGGGKSQCMLKAKEMLSIQKSTVNAEKQIPDPICGCLQGCSEIEYEADTSDAVYNLTIFNNINPNIYAKRCLPSGLVLYFGEERFTSILRSELYSFVEFLAHCGGFMGVFLGFSFLSLAELVFFLTLRLWRRIHNQIAPREMGPSYLPWVF